MKFHHVFYLLQQAEQRAAERAERLRREFERRMKPRTKADFDLLYSALESKWLILSFAYRTLILFTNSSSKNLGRRVCF